MADDSEDVGPLAFEHRKGRDHIIRAGQKRYKGHAYFDIRLFLENGRPTRSGVTMPVELVKPFAEALLSWAEQKE